MKPLRLVVDLTLSPQQVRALIALAETRYTRPATLSDLDRRELARRGVQLAVRQLTQGKI